MTDTVKGVKSKVLSTEFQVISLLIRRSLIKKSYIKDYETPYSFIREQ